MNQTQLSIQFIVDFYKYSHNPMYYPGTQRISSYFESRGTDLEFADKTIFFGLQIYTKKYLQGVVITSETIDIAEDICSDVFDNPNVFNRTFWEHILYKYGGKIPVQIKALPEGTKVKLSNCLFQVTCFDPLVQSITNYVETLLQQVWYPTTVCTLSYYIKQLVNEAFERTVDESWYGAKDFVLNDFGVRGTSCPEEAEIGGIAHIVNFLGSDNVPAYIGAKTLYNAERGKIIKTVPATEHSVMTLLGPEGEIKVYEHCMDVYPNGLISMVCDGYDVLNAAGNIFGDALKEKVMNRKGCTVLRLDSGDPEQTILAVMNILFEKFGFETNSKGFKQLPPYIRIMQSDGVEYDAIKNIYAMLEREGISAANIVGVGMGGALLRKVNRDTFKMAFKCSHADMIINNVLTSVDVQKRPIVLNRKGERKQSFKVSKAGELKVIDFYGELMTVRIDDIAYASYPDLMRVVFDTGVIYNEQTFEEIKTLVAN